MSADRTVVLVSTYELGHQPMGLAAAAAALRQHGHRVECIDVSIDPPDIARFEGASLVAISVPMHTAARLGIRLAASLRERWPELPVAFYGLYAPLLAPTLGERGIEAHLLGGEYEPALCTLADRLVGGSWPATQVVEEFPRQVFPVPDRSGLPSLDRYARAFDGSVERIAGYVEATRGCAHRCRHCPITATYNGRLRLVQPEVVLADIEQQVEAGASHITFGDPDFLNAVDHSLGLVRELRRRHPEVTWDGTIKVEHLLKHAALLRELRDLGCLFVTAAFESCDDEQLRLLDKGHTVDDMSRALELARAAGLVLRPTWLTFTPWTTVEDFLHLLSFVEVEGLEAMVAPVQYGLRLLVPPDSALIPVLREQHLLRDFDHDALSYRWEARDPRSVGLQRRVAALVEQRCSHAADASVTISELRSLAVPARDGAPSRTPHASPAPRHRAPGLTEAWFC